MNAMLHIENLHAAIGDRPILRGVDLSVRAGEVHALMGPNGSGKSTLANVIAGREQYRVTEGAVRYDGRDLLSMPPEERAREGIFLAFQNPVEIPEVSNYKVCEHIASTNLHFGQRIYEFGEAGWVHISYDAAAKRQVLEARKVHGRTVYLPLELEVRVPAGEVYSLPVQLRVDPGSLKGTSGDVLFALAAVDDPTLSTTEKSKFMGPRS